MLTRRESLAVLGGLALSGCRREVPPVEPTFVAAPDYEARGHRLREPSRATPLPRPPAARRAVVIVGAGIAGLSAAWRLREAGVDDVEVVEMASVIGGTARGDAERCPWGAHYLPVPNPESVVTLRLLTALGLARRSEANGGWRFDERHLVFEPEDRLYYRGRWYEGLYLRAGASSSDLAELARFEADMAALRIARGKDQRLAFTLPTALASQDPEFTSLDRETMAAWLKRHRYGSPRLIAFVDYACRDDYGAGIAEVSAWAGLHYFAGRRSIETPETRGTHYFTWPEGNGWLAEQLRRLAGLDGPRLAVDELATAVTAQGELTLESALTGTTRHVAADAVILATPNHVTGRLLGRRPFGGHAPWAVVNLVLNRLPETDTGAWNNVLYEGKGLGYIDASHQRLEQRPPPGDALDSPICWTWYRAYERSERGALLAATPESLGREALAELRRGHPELPRCVERIETCRWGHGTLIPVPGLQFGESRRAFASSHGRVLLAHTDLSGLPFFEEAQFQGIAAAEAAMARLGVAQESWLGPPVLARPS